MSQNIFNGFEVVVQIFKSVLHFFFTFAPDRPDFLFGHLNTLELRLLELFEGIFILGGLCLAAQAHMHFFRLVCHLATQFLH
jgi:hypothetical protein